MYNDIMRIRQRNLLLTNAHIFFSLADILVNRYDIVQENFEQCVVCAVGVLNEKYNFSIFKALLCQ